MDVGVTQQSSVEDAISWRQNKLHTVDRKRIVSPVGVVAVTVVAVTVVAVTVVAVTVCTVWRETLRDLQERYS